MGRLAALCQGRATARAIGATCVVLPSANARRTVVARSSPKAEQQQQEQQQAESPPPPPPAGGQSEEEKRFHEAYQAVYTMSQLYVQDRPAAIPQSEWETRRKKRDMADILEAARRRGKDQEAVRKNLEQLETVLPDLINLNKMKAADWVALSEDVSGAANKLILLKTAFPKADVFAVMANRPRTLLQSEQRIADDAAKVKQLLSGAQDVDAIVQSVPELMDPAALSRSLAFLKSSFPGQDPVALLQENPQILLNLGESNVEDSAEYGELSTKD